MKKIIIFILIAFPLSSIADFDQYSATYFHPQLNILDYISNYEVPKIPDSLRSIFDKVAQENEGVYNFDYIVELKITNPDVISNIHIYSSNRTTKLEEKKADKALKNIIKKNAENWKIDTKIFSDNRITKELKDSFPDGKYFITIIAYYSFLYDCREDDGITECHSTFDNRIFSTIKDVYEAGPPPKKKEKNKSERTSK